MSLVDQSMIPFQEAILMVLVMIFLILAGNTAFVRQSLLIIRMSDNFFAAGLVSDQFVQLVNPHLNEFSLHSLRFVM